jgi:hypothetical protein
MEGYNTSCDAKNLIYVISCNKSLTQMINMQLFCYNNSHEITSAILKNLREHENKLIRHRLIQAALMVEEYFICPSVHNFRHKREPE